MPRGSHVSAMEEPQLLAEDLRAWFRPFRNEIAAQDSRNLFTYFYVNPYRRRYYKSKFS